MYPLVRVPKIQKPARLFPTAIGDGGHSGAIDWRRLELLAGLPHAVEVPNQIEVAVEQLTDDSK